MSGEGIVKLLELAPKNVRDEIGLNSRNRAEFAADFDALSSSHLSVEIMALALFYACRSIANIEKADPIIANLKIDAPTIYSLISLVSVEEFSMTQHLLGEIEKAKKSRQGKVAADARHQKEGSRHLQVKEGREKVRAAWRTGKYSSKDRCAEEEHDAAGITLDAARKALRNQ